MKILILLILFGYSYFSHHTSKKLPESENEIDVIGVAECDEYVTMMMNCLSKNPKISDEQMALLMSQLSAFSRQVKKAMEEGTEETRKETQTACQTLLREIKPLLKEACP